MTKSYMFISRETGEIIAEFPNEKEAAGPSGISFFLTIHSGWQKSWCMLSRNMMLLLTRCMTLL